MRELVLQKRTAGEKLLELKRELLVQEQLGKGNWNLKIEL